MKNINKRLIIILIAATVAVLGVITAYLRTGSSVLSGGIGTVFVPIQRISAAAVSKTNGFLKNIKNSSLNASENKRLKEELAGLRDEVRALEGYKKENERLHELLDLKSSRQETEYTAANIIGRNTADAYSILTIDKGKNDNVSKGAVVIVPEGLVGVVFESGSDFSKVRTVFDAESAISVICARSGDMGIIEGSTSDENGECIMDFIDQKAKMVVGDSVETSGTGGIFPKGIYVGKVKSIAEDGRGLSMEAVIELGVNVRNIGEVLVSTEKSR